MPNDTRALLLAIENYSRAGDLSARLQGTTAAAFEFARWVRDTKGVSLGNIWICTDSDLDPDLTGVHQFGTSRAQVREALLSLCGDARNKTTQLLVFLSGHGYAYSTTAESAPADIFVCSEYANMATGGDASVMLPELQEMLGYWIGGIDHFYFVDCCRNVIDQKHIKPVSLGLSLPGSDVVRPFIYTLYSTATGSQAFTNSGFPKHLLDALHGKGRAKGWTSDNSGMHVLFTLVYEYVKKKVGRQRVDAKLGAGDGVIFALPGIPTNDCSIVVRGAASTDEFTVQLLLKGQKLGDVTVIHGASGRVTAKPEVYGIDVRHPKRGVEQVAPPAGSPIDLYDPCDAEFKLVDIERLPRSSGAEARSYIQLNVPPNVTVDLVNLNTNERIENLAGSVIKEVDSGQYELAVLEQGSPISRQRLAVGPGKTEQPEILSFPRSAARMSILKAIGSVAESRVFDFSESLGPIANVDMGLWLSLLGASKIIAPIDAFSKLSRIPTATFNHLAPGSAAVYVLAAFDAGKVPLAVAAHSSGTLQWHKAKEVKVVEDVQEVTIEIAQPGPNLISVSLGRDQTATFVTHTVPNRVTLLTLSQASPHPSVSSDAKRSLTDLRRYQYILPIAALSNFVDPELRDLVARHTDLKSIRAMFNIQALFCARRAVSFPNVSDSRMLWEDALYGKWLDPMMSVIMCYEMIRRGHKGQLESQLRMVAGNLWRYFKLPDSQAILSILGEQTVPSTPPLFIDGVLPFTENSDLLSFPASKLDYTSPWTTWRNVVDVDAAIL